MRRTRETMERVRAAMGLDPTAYRTDPRLVEVHFGDWQGFTFAELESAQPGLDARRARCDKWNFVPPGEGAESYQMLLRTRAAVVRGAATADRLRHPWRRHAHAVPDGRGHARKRSSGPGHRPGPRAAASRTTGWNGFKTERVRER